MSTIMHRKGANISGALGCLPLHGLMAQHSLYVLFDYWFSYPATIIEIVRLKLNVVGRLKKSTRIKYFVNGEKKTVGQIYSSFKKRRGKSKYLLSVAVKLYNPENEIIDARIVFVRNRNNKKDWIALISTDMNLTEEEITQLYAIRWDIEVFFKYANLISSLVQNFRVCHMIPLLLVPLLL